MRVLDSEGCPLKNGGLELRDECASCRGRPSCGQLELVRHGVLYMEEDRGDSVYAIISGFLRETRTHADGRTIGIRLVCPGDLLGTEAISFEPYQCTVEALTSTRVCRVAVSEVERAILQRPNQGVLLSRLLGKEAITLRNGVLLVGSMSAQERIKCVLMRILENVPRGEWLRLPLSRTELAELLGLAGGTVSRTLQRLAREGVFEVSGRMIRIP